MPKKSIIKYFLTCLIGLSVLLAGCGKSHVDSYPTAKTSHQSGMHNTAPLPSGNGGYVKTGKPYKVMGQWYYPLASAADYNKTGVASWYGKKFHGKKTANGERYDMHTMSAAHKTLPMPTMVRVTNLDNGRSVVVRVNDRGPFVKSRIIDLSYAAARSLGYDQKGTAHVRVQTLDGNINTAHNSPSVVSKSIQKSSTNGVAYSSASTQDGGIYVQLGAFLARNNASQLRQELADTFPSIRIYHRSQPDLYRVRIGPFNKVSETESIIISLQKQGYHNTVVVVE